MNAFKSFMKIGLALLLILPFIFIYLTFVNSKDCNQFVIDTYEIHSRIDIPEVSPINCYYDKNANVRISIYKLDGGLSRQFSVSDKVEGIKLLKGKFLLKEDELPVSENLLIATGHRWGRTWTFLYEVETRRLWAELKY